MRSMTREGAPHGGDAEHVGERHDDVCRWCGGPAARTWSVEPGGAGRAVDCSVCAACQDLTLAGDDTGLPDRHLTGLTARVGFPVTVDSLRDQGAARLARWIVRRASFRPLDHGAVR